MDPRASLDVIEKKKFLGPCWKSNPDRSNSILPTYWLKLFRQQYATGK
jgi:hypothetical protein